MFSLQSGQVEGETYRNVKRFRACRQSARGRTPATQHYESLNISREDRVQQSLLLADGAASQFAEPIAAYRAAQGADPAVSTVWSYGLLGALHFVTLWWLRDQETDIDLVIDRITSLLWSGMGLEAGIGRNG